jgi:glycosyltransferase involved in cell wall biosynthesis
VKTDPRIVVVHLITRLELGGAQLNTVYTAEHLDPQRFDVFLCSGPGGPLNARLAGAERWVVVPALTREIRPGKDIKALFSLLRLFRRIKPDVVHTHSSKAGILGRLAAFAARVPVVVHTVHGFSFSPAQPFLKRNFYLIFVAESDIRSARVHHVLGRNYSLIRSGFPLQKFRGRSSAATLLREKYQLPRAAFVCGVIAPFKPQKGLFHLLDIAARVIGKNPAIVFFIAGDGEQRRELENELHRLGISRNFRLPGFITDIENVIDCFDIGVSTALWEGLPQSLVQLRLKKKAVVASDIPGNREVIRDNVNGLIVPLTDHEGFASAILRLASDPAFRERLAGCASDDFSEWDADRMVRRQEELYVRLLGLRRGARRA